MFRQREDQSLAQTARRRPPDKLRAHRCFIRRRRRLIVRATVRFRFERPPAASSSSRGQTRSRGRARGNQLAENAGIVPIDSLCRVVIRLSGIHYAGRSNARSNDAHREPRINRGAGDSLIMTYTQLVACWSSRVVRGIDLTIYYILALTNIIL